jgi:hypothetical protein
VPPPPEPEPEPASEVYLAKLALFERGDPSAAASCAACH